MAINYKNEIKKCLNDYKSIKTIYKQVPNILTVIRAIGIIPVNILYFTGNIIPAIIVSVIMFLSDLFDGMIARKYNIMSEFGAKLDAVCDKVMFIGLSIPLLNNNLIIIINLMLEICIGGINLLNERKGYDPKTILSGKLKTWLLFITLGIGYLSLILNILPMLFNLLVIGTGFIQGVVLSKYTKKFIYMDNNMKKETNFDNECENNNYENRNVKSNDIVYKCEMKCFKNTKERKVRKRIKER